MLSLNPLKTLTKTFKKWIDLTQYVIVKYNWTKIEKVNIIFLDPPYHEGILNKAIKLIEEIDILNEKGLIVAEYEEENPICNYNLIKEKKYGDKHINIYQK